jgi:hypothetical protein
MQLLALRRDLNAGAMPNEQLASEAARRWLGRAGGSQREPKPNPAPDTN